MDQMIRILGVDPGLRHTGWGVIAMDGPRLSWVAHGVIEPDPKADIADRLAELCVQLRAVIHEPMRRQEAADRGDLRQHQPALDPAAGSGTRRSPRDPRCRGLKVARIRGDAR
jgi:hypothetical protein